MSSCIEIVQGEHVCKLEVERRKCGNFGCIVKGSQLFDITNIQTVEYIANDANQLQVVSMTPELEQYLIGIKSFKYFTQGNEVENMGKEIKNIRTIVDIVALKNTIYKPFQDHFGFVITFNHPIVIYHKIGKRLTEALKRVCIIPQFFCAMGDLLHVCFENPKGWSPYSSLNHNKRFEDFITAENLLKMYLDIAGVLKTLHIKNFVHRDVKPENVLVCNRASELKFILIDYGLSGLAGFSTEGTDYYKHPKFVGRIGMDDDNTETEFYNGLYKFENGQSTYDIALSAKGINAGSVMTYTKLPSFKHDEFGLAMCINCFLSALQKKGNVPAEIDTFWLKETQLLCGENLKSYFSNGVRKTYNNDPTLLRNRGIFLTNGGKASKSSNEDTMLKILIHDLKHFLKTQELVGPHHAHIKKVYETFQNKFSKGYVPLKVSGHVLRKHNLSVDDVLNWFVYSIYKKEITHGL